MIPGLFIVIVNWNLKDDTEGCIRSLERAGAYLGQIIVVDNGSIDESTNHLRGKFGPSLRIIELERNLGYAAAVNIGIREAFIEGVEWFLILNNDTWVAEDFFEVLFKAVNKYPKYAVFGPTIFYADYPDMVWYLGERVVPGTMLTINKYKGRVLPTGLPEVMPVDFLSGCAMLVKRQLFKDVGLLDTNFFMYGEEVDWCWRARRAGHRLAAVPDAFMWHKVSASSNRISSFARFLQVRNQIWGYRRYGNRYHKLMLFIFTLFRILSIFLNEIRSGQTTLWRSSLEGWVAGWWHDIPPVSEFL